MRKYLLEHECEGNTFLSSYATKEERDERIRQLEADDLVTNIVATDDENCD